MYKVVEIEGRNGLRHTSSHWRHTELKLQVLISDVKDTLLEVGNGTNTVDTSAGVASRLNHWREYKIYSSSK